SSVVVATDCEHPSDGSIDANLLELATGADLLIYDAQYTPEEYNPAAHGSRGPSKIGWGHSTMVEGAKLAKTAGVKHLVLTHHDPLHNDVAIDAIEKRAKSEFPSSQAAFEGLVIQI
ncbi:MAG TPA: MBL fold metallo-hydrolase, partial [Candidatus Ozemobacteraceae bacterium]|nr:MBL fold metallo-hydrolase [Candidatus Ozemobacteraceae bacterium]